MNLVAVRRALARTAAAGMLTIMLNAGACAATYYVSTSGSDANPGTSPDAAWATISRGDALGILRPGDTVLVAEGVYRPADLNGVYLMVCSGTAEQPIIYRAVGRAVIDQSHIAGVSYGFMLKVNGTVIARSAVPVMWPEDPFECIGSICNVIFTCGVVERDGKCLIYYGAADSTISVATTDWERLRDVEMIYE